MSDRNVDRERRRFSHALQSALTLDEVASAYLDTVGRVIQADGLGLYILDSAAGTVVDVYATVGGEMLDEYEEYGRPDDPVLRFVTERRSPIDSSRVAVPEAWDRCGARQALRTEGLAHSMEAPLIVSGVMYGTISFARRPGSFAVFGEQDLASARIVGEELGLATERALRYEATVRRAAALEHALDRMAQAVVVTDLDGQLLFQNRIARRDWDFEVVPDGVPRPGAIVTCIGEGLAALRDDGRRVFTRSVHDGGRKAIVKTYRPSERDDTAVTVVFPCAEETVSQRLPIWEVLTRREQEIAQLVSEGLTTKQIAARAFISENTVKQHLKRVFAKTDVSNRAELVQLIWTSGRPSG
ncbi:LuxR C-terminal-related transcriptional regulator [Streptomyces sp. NPDC093149]|uniref:LuxR C-terminal-related transcriptional regulator n=1 Tax=Streptomyces sp. NPDC093149 TaxID=3366031 RepID=UPI00382864CA